MRASKLVADESACPKKAREWGNDAGRRLNRWISGPGFERVRSAVDSSRHAAVPASGNVSGALDALE